MRFLLLALVFGFVASLDAQGLRSEPITFGDGRVVLAGELTATVGEEDPGFFNYSDYEFNALRNLRFGLSAEVKASRRLQLLTEIRVDRSGEIEPFALYARFRPFPARRFDIQAGLVPPTFGLFSRQGYGTGNMLIGTPLGYQYLLSIRSDALPDSLDDVLRMRGRGWLSSFPVGNTRPAPGMPLVHAFRLDTGLQVHGVAGMLEWIASITAGSLSNPLVGDDNGGRQMAGRAVLRPIAALALGVSGARGQYLSEDLEPGFADGASVRDAVQSAVGVDAEYSYGRFLARGEVIHSRWSLPRVGQVGLDSPLASTASTIEARYKLIPGVYVAGRVERLDFSRLYTAAGGAEWEAPVRRVEFGAGYFLLRNVQVKGTWQRNRRDGGRVRHDSLASAQVVYWF